MNECTRDVAECYPNELASGLVRLDHETMREMVVAFGDAVEIEGDSRTVAKVCPADPETRIPETIRIDQFTRDNAGVAIDDSVTIRRVSTARADEVVLSSNPVPNICFIDDARIAARRQLLRRPVLKGDTVSMVFDMESSEAPRFRVPLAVAETEPEGAVVVTGATEISIPDE